MNKSKSRPLCMYNCQNFISTTRTTKNSYMKKLTNGICLNIDQMNNYIFENYSITQLHYVIFSNVCQIIPTKTFRQFSVIVMDSLQSSESAGGISVVTRN